MELDNILDELDDVLSSAGSIPVLNYKLVKASDVDMILEKLRGAVPLEIKRAHDLLEEQKDIKEKAHAEADQIIEQARARSRPDSRPCQSRSRPACPSGRSCESGGR